MLPEAVAAAAGDGDLRVLERWLAGGGDVDAADSCGHTLLYQAARHGDCDALRFLLARGARVAVQNRGEVDLSETALHIAASLCRCRR